VSDSNLVLGVLAVQLNFATPAQVMSASAAWMADRSQGLAERLEKSGTLTQERRKVLEGLVTEALRSHGGDAAKALSAVGGESALFRSFGGSVSLSAAGELVPRTLGALPTDEAITHEQPGHYTIKGEHGRGGQSQIFLAVDEHIGREVALKQLLPEATTSESLKATPVGRTTAAAIRFLREARITGRLEHPNIVPVYELGRRADGSHYYTQKLVRGDTLRKKLAACKNLTERLKLLGHFLDICQAMAYAHSKQVVHRDLKPDNVMIGEFGETVVLDWGLAKVQGQEEPQSLNKDAAKPGDNPNVTVDGHALGTPSYMSPEQALGNLSEVDERSDVWSLGAILYELLAGRPPYTGDTALEVIGKVISDPVPPIEQFAPAAPGELVAIAKRAMNKDSAGRYASAREMAKEVELWQSGGRVAAYSYSSWELLRRFVGQNKLLVVIGLLSVLAILYVVPAWVQQKRVASAAVQTSLQLDNEVRSLDLQMVMTNDKPIQLEQLEDQRIALVARAERARVVAEQTNPGARVGHVNNPLEADLHRILVKFAADTYLIPPMFVERVRFYVSKLSTSPYAKKGWARRTQSWPVIHRELAALGIPDEMAYVAWQESYFDPYAQSSFGARGIWQLTDKTARAYGVRVDEDWREGGVDERVDVEKETKGAAQYIYELLTEFGSDQFILAVVSYNQGNALSAVLKKAGFHREKRDFWRLYRTKQLPDQTIEYVAQVLAVAVIGLDPAGYGMEK
jgi:serine/threonine protein kinase